MHSMSPRGALSVRRVPLLERPIVRTVADALRYSRPGMWGDARRFGLQNRAEHFQRSLADQAEHQMGRLPFIGHLWLAKVGTDGKVTDYGLVSCRVVTTAGVNYLVDSLQGLVEPELLRFHGVGTGTTAEDVGQTALAAELTTQYSTANTRPQGTLGEKTGASNVFETSATVTVSAAVGVTEHAIFSQAATGGGTMLDRSVFAVVNLGSGESLQSTYQLTLPAGG